MPLNQVKIYAASIGTQVYRNGTTAGLHLLEVIWVTNSAIHLVSTNLAIQTDQP